MKGWGSEAGWLAIAIAAGFLLRPAIGAFGPTLALGAWLAWRIRDMRRLQRWIDRSITRPPRLSGVPEAVAWRLWRVRRESRRRLRRLANTLSALREATDALPDAIVLLEKGERIRWFNSAGARLLGLRRADRGTGLSGLLRTPQLLPLLQNPEREGTLELPSPRADGKTLEIRVVLLNDARRLLLVRDITQVARLRTMRQDFIANVSHELRTPLTVILGYLEALDDETDTAVLQATLPRLQRPALRMKRLVEDLLLLSRLDATGSIPPEASDHVDIPAMLGRIVSEARQLATPQHRIELEAQPGLHLSGVEQELHSAFTNLVTNAIRYSPEGGRVLVRWRSHNSGARLEVSDEGIGIAGEHIPRITERFYRVDVGRSRESGGTGLGLAIVKHVLRRHDSELDIRSRPNAGSTFGCTFPPARVRREVAKD